jgi:hypothetical protein
LKIAAAGLSERLQFDCVGIDEIGPELTKIGIVHASSAPCHRGIRTMTGAPYPERSRSMTVCIIDALSMHYRPCRPNPAPVE